MPAVVQMVFDPKGMMVLIGQIMPVGAVRPESRTAQQYLRLAASIREIGVIEPPIIHPQATPKGHPPRYTLLDGHLRLDALRELGSRRPSVWSPTTTRTSPTTTRSIGWLLFRSIP